MSRGRRLNALEPYLIPRLIDCNACTRALRGYNKVLIVGRCVEREHPEALKAFQDYASLSVCLEEEHMNMVGFKLAGIIARQGGAIKEVTVLTVDGSPHCVQLHFMVEEVFKVLSPKGVRRRHFIITRGNVKEIPLEAVHTARYLSRVAKLLGSE